MISYEWVQKEDKVPVGKFESFLWSPRGKLTRITSPSQIDKLLARGFKPATAKELEKFKAGAYFPPYDQGVLTTTPIAVKKHIPLSDKLELMVL